MKKPSEIIVCTPISFYHLEGVSPLGIQILSMAHGYRLSGQRFYASDAYLADVFNKTDRGIRKAIGVLKGKKFIESEILRDEETKRIQGRELSLTKEFDIAIEAIRSLRNQSSASPNNLPLEASNPTELWFREAQKPAEPQFQKPPDLPEPEFQKPAEPQFPLYTSKRNTSNTQTIVCESAREEKIDFEFFDENGKRVGDSTLLNESEKNPPHFSAPPPPLDLEEEWQDDPVLTRFIEKLKSVPDGILQRSRRLYPNAFSNPGYIQEIEIEKYCNWKICELRKIKTEERVATELGKSAFILWKGYEKSWLTNYQKFNPQQNGKSNRPLSYHQAQQQFAADKAKLELLYGNREAS